MSNKFDLGGKKFLVTGASSGIGREVCKLIYNFNGKFIAVARKENELIDLLNETSSTENSYVVADLTKELDIERLVLGVNGVDGVIHSAGINKIVPLKFYSKEVIDEIRTINLDAILFLMSLITSKKKLNKGSSVVLVSSLGGIAGIKGNGIYSSTKGALISVSKVWANELAPQKIRVNCVAPGMVRTEIVKKTIEHLSAETVAEDEKKYPFGYGNPEDVAYPIIFLLSEASRWITGQTFILDGGRSSFI